MISQAKKFINPPSPVTALRWLAAACCLFALPVYAALQFSEVSVAAGASYTHGIVSPIDEYDESESGGVAAGDYDRDGHTDLYIVTGDAYDNVLLRNTGSGTFTDQTAGSGVAMTGIWSSGPVFADINGDGWQDLLVGSMHAQGYHVFINDQDGTFTDASAASLIVQQAAGQNDISSGLGDVDNDGDLDLFIGHHRFQTTVLRNHLWINNGSGVFTAGDLAAGVTAFGNYDMSFTPNFVDINGDGWQDLLITADRGESTVYLNDGDGTFTDATTADINDQFGMGSAPADYDNDGDIDWFVTSIHYNPQTQVSGPTGNRLYINNGNGVFTETSQAAGVRIGYWGWGACAADFDNDGWLDIFHVNGMHDIVDEGTNYSSDPSRLFMNDHDGTFTESSQSTGLFDTGMGRGEVCFDYDEDGDIDIFVFNADGLTRLYRNDLTDNPGWLQVDVVEEAPGMTVAGTIIQVVTGALTQTREVTVGSNFESQNPLRQHFGLGGAGMVDQLTVTWPSGFQVVMTDVAINQLLLVEQPPPELPMFDDGFEATAP